MPNFKTGCQLIAEERDKQVIQHGYTISNDKSHRNKELLYGALAYLNAAIYGTSVGKENWPFENKYWHPEGYIDCLKKAGAFIAAELDRLQLN